jgi:hypothetical protein
MNDHTALPIVYDVKPRRLLYAYNTAISTALVPTSPDSSVMCSPSPGDKRSLTHPFTFHHTHIHQLDTRDGGTRCTTIRRCVGQPCVYAQQSLCSLLPARFTDFVSIGLDVVTCRFPSGSPLHLRGATRAHTRRPGTPCGAVPSDTHQRPPSPSGSRDSFADRTRSSTSGWLVGGVSIYVWRMGRAESLYLSCSC